MAKPKFTLDDFVVNINDMATKLEIVAIKKIGNMNVYKCLNTRGEVKEMLESTLRKYIV